MSKLITAVAKIREAYQRASRSDQEQIVAFTRANTEPPPVGFRKSGRYPEGWRWALAEYRNLDNGKTHLGASIGLADGVPTNDFRAAIGLPRLPEPKKPVPPKNTGIKPKPVKTVEGPRKPVAAPKPVNRGKVPTEAPKRPSGTPTASPLPSRTVPKPGITPRPTAVNRKPLKGGKRA